MSESSDDPIHNGYLEELIEEEIHDPYVAKMEAQVEAHLEARLLGVEPEQQIRHSRKHIERDRQGDHDRLFAFYFSN